MINTALQEYMLGGCAEIMQAAERYAEEINNISVTNSGPNEQRNAFDSGRAQIATEKPRYCGTDLYFEGGRVIVSCAKSVEVCGFKSRTDGIFRPHQD